MCELHLSGCCHSFGAFQHIQTVVKTNTYTFHVREVRQDSLAFFGIAAEYHAAINEQWLAFSSIDISGDCLKMAGTVHCLLHGCSPAMPKKARLSCLSSHTRKESLSSKANLPYVIGFSCCMHLLSVERCCIGVEVTSFCLLAKSV